MDSPKLIRVDGINSSSDKAMVIIPGMCTKNKNKSSKYVTPLRDAGWDGEIHYLWWDSSTKEDFIKDASKGMIAGPLTPVAWGLSVAAILRRYQKIHHRAKRTGRKCLPQLLTTSIPEKRISFLAHSLGSYMLYKWMKKFDEYPVSNSIEDIILLGGTVSRKKENWPVNVFRNMYNVYNIDDPLLKKYKYTKGIARLKKHTSPCGRKIIREQYVPNISNINVAKYVGDSHSNYQIVFSNGMMKYLGSEWQT